MSDARRFPLFADMIAARFGSARHIADVAGGKGYLKSELHRRGFGGVTTWDKCRAMRGRGNRPGYRYGLFAHDQAPAEYDLVVGMHPDAGSDHIIRYAARHRIPFALCPCCVTPSAERYDGPRTFGAWVEHLARIAERTHRVTETYLKIQGCNVVLVGSPT